MGGGGMDPQDLFSQLFGGGGGGFFGGGGGGGAYHSSPYLIETLKPKLTLTL